MYLAYTVYLSLLIIMLLFTIPCTSSQARNQSNVLINKVSWEFPILILALILGCRYGVGVDYFSYEELYFSQERYSIFDSNANEYIFGGIYSVCYNWGIPYYIVQITLNFIFFYFFYKTFEERKKLFPWIIVFFFFTGLLFLYLNIQRQGIALAILMYSIQYIEKKNFVFFLFYVILAAGFHLSAVSFIVIYFIHPLIKYFRNNKIQFALWIAGFIFSLTIIKLFFNLSMTLLSDTKYGRYGASILTLETDKGSGSGLFVRGMFDIFIISQSKKLLSYYGKKSYFEITYFIFFIGCILSNIFQYNLLLSRLAFLFVSFRIVVLAYVFDYVFKRRNIKDIITAIIILLIGFFYFLGMIYLGNNNCSPFQFISCHHLYH